MFGLCAAALLTLCGCMNFHTVKEGKVYRSAQPEAVDIERWADKHGIKTIIRLRGGQPGQWHYEADMEGVTARNLKFIHIPMAANRHPKKQELVRLVEALETAEYPVLIHCMAGADRTGLASAVFVLMDGGTVEQARKQFDFGTYKHTGKFGTEKLDEVLDMYEPWQSRLSFAAWVRHHYEQPEDGVFSKEDRQANVAEALKWNNAKPR